MLRSRARRLRVGGFPTWGFRAWAIPVEVRPTFWVMGSLLGLVITWRSPDRGPMLVSWIIILFVSVLAHELGHAVVARRFAATARIRLHGTGGATAWAMQQPVSPGRRIAVAAAGSAVGLTLGVAVWGVGVIAPELFGTGVGRRSMLLFVQVNVFWGVLNWLPVRLLDGGHILSGVLEVLVGRHAPRVADIVFPVILGAIAWWAWSAQFVVGVVIGLVALVAELGRRRDPSAAAGRLT